MEEDIVTAYRRWIAAEESGGDDDADAACGAAFRAAEPVLVNSAQFTARTMEAIVAATVRDARRARWTRAGIAWGAALGGVVTAYFAAGVIASAISTAFVRLLDLLIAAIVSTASGMKTGLDIWSVLATVGRAAAAFVASPTVTVTIFAIQGIAIAALVVLQRLLRSDGEGFE